MEMNLIKKTRSDGRLSLYLEYNLEGIQQTEDIHLTLERPVSDEDVRTNEDKMLLAKQICAKREWEIIAEYNRVSLPYPHLLPYNFIDLFSEFVRDYRGKDIHTVQAALKHLRLFVKDEPLMLKSIDVRFCHDFYCFLQNRLRGNTPAGYYKKFSACLNQCRKDHLIASNPAREVRLVGNNELTKDILGAEELQRIASLHYERLHLREVWRAFLFSCNTGLRWCDVYALRYENIDVANGLLHVTQQKVRNHSGKAVLHLNLNQNALSLLALSSGQPEDKVFRLPSYTFVLRLLDRIVKDAGISKHITFHCARHSFITELIVYGADIKTAAELAGHSTIRHTERYVHLVDKLKQQALDNLPLLPL